MTATVKKRVMPRLRGQRCGKCNGEVVTGNNGHGVCVDCGPLEMLPKSAIDDLTAEEIAARGPRKRAES